MRGRFYFWPLMGMLWFLNAGAVDGQENAGLLLSAAAQDSHQMNMGNKKDGNGFQHVHALAIDGAGKAMFLGTHVGLFRSDGNSNSWKKIALSAKQSNFDIMGVTPDPKDPKTIYVATHEAGVFKSNDGGTTWKEANNGLGGMDVHGLAIDPNAPQKLHAAVREKGDGVYRTTDGGAKWTRVDDGPDGEVKVLKIGKHSDGNGRNFSLRGNVDRSATQSRLFLRMEHSGRSAHQSDSKRLCHRS